jgi:hypothetical protein
MKRSLYVALVLYAVAAPATLAATRPQTAAPNSGSQTPSQLALAERDQQKLMSARPGERDLYDLTRRLKLHSRTPISPYVSGTASSCAASAPASQSSPRPRAIRTTVGTGCALRQYNLGHVETFWVAQATSGYFPMKATLMVKTAHAYWYVGNNIDMPRDKLLAALQKSAADFEQHVYPTDHAAFGQEWATGPDRDPRITVLCANLPGGVGGYYSAEDLYPTSVNAYSNQRKMLYVDPTAYAPGTPEFSATIAHELQHMIHWYQHERDDTWINEGSSVLAQVINGYGTDGVDQSFAAAPGTQVNNFCYGAPNCSDSSAFAYYGSGFLWMLYFYQHYGGNTALHTLLADKNLSGMMLFDDVLSRLGSHDTARDMFGKWVIANLVDDPTIDGGIYGYRHAYDGCCIHAVANVSAHAYPFTHRGTVNQFATDYVELKPAGASTLHLQFSGDPTVKIVNNTPLGATTEWWSNRGDELDSTLTRSFDLSKVGHATLKYDAWYDIERDFDYGYVEVSTDGGVTWQTLHAPHTTNSDPNGANYGNGYTGTSGGWLHESIDLSRYAGKRIMVRFEHITDDAYNASGFTLDNIRIPEIGFADDGSGRGWQSNGWVRISNLLPTRWLVQMVLYTTHGVQVRQVDLSPDATGQATITGLGTDVQRVVLAVSPTALQTTIPSRYTLVVK